jgi:hypothetical protein
MTKKYELLADDSLSAGDRTVYRIRALRDFGDVRCGDLGGYIESEFALSQDGECWVHGVAQVYGPNGSVEDNARIKGEAWVLGRVDGHAQICDLAVIAEDAHVGGHTIVCSDEIVRGGACRTVEQRPAGVAASYSVGFVRQTL